MNDSALGTSIFGTSVSPTPSPPSYSASMAASFMGCTSATLCADLCPVAAAPSEAISPTITAILMLSFASLSSRFFIRYQQETATTKTAPIIHAEITVWQNLSMAKGDKATSKNDTISLRMVSGLNSHPTGYCIHAFATRIHHADMVAPSPVSHVEARWNPGDTFFQPKNITATKVDSIKKATMPSTASGAPKMSPTNQE